MVLWSWLVVFVSPFRPLTVQNVKMCWNLSHSGVEVSRQLDIPSTKIGEGAHYLFLYLSSSCSSLPCIRLSAVLLKHLISLFHSLIQRQYSLLGHHSLAFLKNIYLKYHKVSAWRSFNVCLICLTTESLWNVFIWISVTIIHIPLVHMSWIFWYLNTK